MIKHKKLPLKKKKKQPSLLLTLSAAGLLIGGGAAAYWFLIQHHGWLGNAPVGANIIPQDALLTISVSTDAGKWQQLRNYGGPELQAELDKNLVQLRDRFLTSQGYDYQRDIQPWVGKEVTIAFLPSQTAPTGDTTLKPPNAASNQQESFVLVLPIANPERAKQTLAAPSPPKQGKWVDRSYKGFQIKEIQGSPSENYSATVLDGQFLVVTDSAKATDEAIDTYKGGTSLLKIPGYTSALSKIDAPQPFGRLYVNVPQAAKVAATNPGRAVLPQGFAQLQQKQGLATTVNLEPNGILFKSISWLKPNSQHVYVVENKAGKMQSRLPDSTLMMLSGGDLQQLWQDYVQETQSSPLAPIAPQYLRSGIKSLTNLDLDQDLLSWMGGEFSVSVIPSAPKQGSPENSALSLVFMVQTNDRERAEKSLQQLDQVMSRQYQFKLQEAQVNGQSVVNWVAPNGTVTASHSWLDRNVACLTLGAPVTDAIIPKPSTTLASTQLFQTTVPSDLSPNNGQFFLDVERTLKTFPLPNLSANQQMLVNAIHSIGVTTALSNERSIRYDIFVETKKR